MASMYLWVFSGFHGISESVDGWILPSILHLAQSFTDVLSFQYFSSRHSGTLMTYVS